MGELRYILDYDYGDFRIEEQTGNGYETIARVNTEEEAINYLKNNN